MAASKLKSTPTLHVGDSVRVLRNISRYENEHYAYKGDTGTVVGVFKDQLGACGTTRWHVKVRMSDGYLKTFRRTSLEKII